MVTRCNLFLMRINKQTVRLSLGTLPGGSLVPETFQLQARGCNLQSEGLGNKALFTCSFPLVTNGFVTFAFGFPSLQFLKMAGYWSLIV